MPFKLRKRTTTDYTAIPHQSSTGTIELPSDDQVIKELTHKIAHRERRLSHIKNAGMGILGTTTALAIIGPAVLGLCAGLGALLISNPVGWAVLGAIAILGGAAGIALIAKGHGTAMEGLEAAGTGALVGIAVVLVVGILFALGGAAGASSGWRSFGGPSFAYTFTTLAIPVFTNNDNTLTMGREVDKVGLGIKDLIDDPHWRRLTMKTILEGGVPINSETDANQSTKEALQLIAENPIDETEIYEKCRTACLARQQNPRRYLDRTDYVLLSHCIIQLEKQGRDNDAILLYEVTKKRLNASMSKQREDLKNGDKIPKTERIKESEFYHSLERTLINLMDRHPKPETDQQ